MAELTVSPTEDGRPGRGEGDMGLKMIRLPLFNP